MTIEEIINGDWVDNDECYGCEYYWNCNHQCEENDNNG